jgi:hypothetical protein
MLACFLNYPSPYRSGKRKAKPNLLHDPIMTADAAAMLCTSARKPRVFRFM